jgi:hypothetical protein
MTARRSVMQKLTWLHHTTKPAFVKILSASAMLFIFTVTALMDPATKKAGTNFKTTATERKIQAAILLDVSGSMEGLIEQAKAQLWNMVTIMGKAKCEEGSPKIEIALYEYGRSTNSPKAGYIKQISPFTSDLDQLSQELFKLTTNGSEEYCGQVIYTSLNELKWDSSSSNYKVIFIAGNEDFLQGTLHYTRACDLANKKGVIVNTIYCGDRMQGIQEHWNLAGECGNGSFTNINQDAKIEDIPTPYDSALIVLNSKLNGTYVYYGEMGLEGYTKQASVDQSNFSTNKSAGLKRATAKSNSKIYSNSGWDLVDASNADSIFYRKVDMNTLPDSLKNRSREELQKVIAAKSNERLSIQNQIQQLSDQRNNFIAAEKTKNGGSNIATLETEVEKIIKNQALRFNMKIE